MHQFHTTYPATMEQMTFHPLPFNNNQSAFAKPQTYAPASCLPSFCPERRVPDDFCHTYFRGTLVRDYNWPVRRTFCAPLETGNAIHNQQGNHYHHPACHMSYYNCCTHVWRSLDHYYSPPKRPRMVEDNLRKSTEGSTDISGKRFEMHQVPKKNETATCKRLPSPPPLIRTCLKQKESRQPHLKKLVERKTYEKDVLTEEHVSKNREPASKIQVPVVDCSMTHRQISNGGYRNEFMKKFSNERKADIEQHNQNFIGPDEFETEPRNDSLNGKWTSLNDTQKSCKSTPAFEEKLCSNRQVEKQVEQQSPLQQTVERSHLATGENAQRLGQATGLGKEKQRSVIVQNDNYKVNKRRHSHYESIPQEGLVMPQEGLKRSQSFPITERRDTCCNKGDDFYETKPKDHNAEYRVPLFKDYCERKTVVRKRLIQNTQQRHLSNGAIHPQLKFYPQPNTNHERNRSKSFDATKIQTSTSQSLCQNLQPENFSNRIKKQSEVLCEPILRDKSLEHGHADLCSPTISGRYRHEHEKGPGPKSGHWETVSYKNSSASLSGLTSARKEIRQQPLIDQPQATMKIERIPQQHSNISKRRCNSDSSLLHFQENQPLSCDNTEYIPKYLDANHTAVWTHCDVSRDQGKKSPHVTKNQGTVSGKVRQFGNVTSSVSPNGPHIIGPISLSELQKRRTALSQRHVSFNNTRPNMSRVLHNRTAVNDQKSHDQEVVEEPKLPRKDISSVSLQQTALNFPDIEHQNHEVKISVVSSDYSDSVNIQSLKDEPAEQPTCQSRTLPPLPSGKELDKIDSGCGGYAIDHNALPRIVAVHSIVTNDESFQEQETDLFSMNDKKYWKDLLRRLTSDEGDSEESKSFEITQANIPEINKVDDPKDIEYQQDDDSTVEQENESNPNELNKVNKWTLWKYLSTPSKDLTIEIKCPSTDCDETVDAKKKTQPVRRKLTVRELSDKILYTRERIRKEEIPWKKKLLVSLEATFIKRLRKTEKETGEKADNFVLKQNEDDDNCKETGDRKKCNKQGRKRKIAAKS